MMYIQLLFLLNLTAVLLKYHFRLHNIAFNTVYSVYEDKLIKHIDVDLLIVLPMQHLIVSFTLLEPKSVLSAHFNISMLFSLTI